MDPLPRRNPLPHLLKTAALLNTIPQDPPKQMDVSGFTGSLVRTLLDHDDNCVMTVPGFSSDGPSDPIKTVPKNPNIAANTTKTVVPTVNMGITAAAAPAPVMTTIATRHSVPSQSNNLNIISSTFIENNTENKAKTPFAPSRKSLIVIPPSTPKLETHSSFASSSRWTPTTPPQGRTPSYRGLCLPSTASSVSRLASRRHDIQFGVRQGLKTLSVDHTIHDTSLAVVGSTPKSRHNCNPLSDSEDHLEAWLRDDGDSTTVQHFPIPSPQLPSFSASRRIRVSLSTNSSRSSQTSASRPVTTSWAAMTHTTTNHLKTAPTTPHSSLVFGQGNSRASSLVIGHQHIMPSSSQLPSQPTSRGVSPHRLSIVVPSVELQRYEKEFGSLTDSDSDQIMQQEEPADEEPPAQQMCSDPVTGISQGSPIGNASPRELQMLRALPQYEAIMQRLQDQDFKLPLDVDPMAPVLGSRDLSTPASEDIKYLTNRWHHRWHGFLEGRPPTREWNGVEAFGSPVLALIEFGHSANQEVVAD
ncbi:hypothetical protein CEUSTIGMA_g5723.t1 [Chlamydomonas eustigma]|uniref:Uncharacterized protein n=1 Tax=Chlamydomonas eustigma TaxID=1157962 RepID=A0A250X5C5_9CHLO|nr:hypothetical protein CEUSTIGMA_g5723.t1 [Chlamydomonas eustigma]|eukprot:GAX78281.1 hypothetical protein CEUSTIGMA_g5723.t1 [Chlamydomonas eustigma]